MALLDMGMEGDVLLKRDQPFPESPAEVTSLSLAPTGWLWTWLESKLGQQYFLFCIYSVDNGRLQSQWAHQSQPQAWKTSCLHRWAQLGLGTGVRLLWAGCR